MRWLAKIVTVAVMLVAVSSINIGMATRVNAATVKSYDTHGVVEWVYGPEQNGPGVKKVTDNSTGGSDANHNPEKTTGGITDTPGTISTHETAVIPHEPDVAQKVVADSHDTLPTNGVASASGQQNSQLPQTGGAVDALQRIVQIFGGVLLLSAILMILKKKSNSKFGNAVTH